MWIRCLELNQLESDTYLLGGKDFWTKTIVFLGSVSDILNERIRKLIDATKLVDAKEIEQLLLFEQAER